MKRKIFGIIVLILISTLAPSANGQTSIFKRGPSRERKSSRESTKLKDAEEAFIRGNYEEVIAIGSSYLAGKAKSNYELEYLMGRAFLKLGRIDEARNRFSKIINNGEKEELLDDAYTGLADSYYLEGDYNKAKENYEKVIHYFPNSDCMPIVYYRLGNCALKLGNGSSAKEYFDKLTREYPFSLETRLLTGDRLHLVTYCVQVGAFKSWKNAKGLYDELTANGFDANISAADLGESSLYRVRVGNFGSLGDAEEMARTLKNKGYEVKIYP